MLAKQTAAKGPKLSVGSKFERRYKIKKMHISETAIK
jgi:hypothetical protein